MACINLRTFLYQAELEFLVTAMLVVVMGDSVYVVQ